MKTNKNSKNISKISLLLLGMAIIFSFGVGSVAAESNSTIYVNGTGGSDVNNGTSTQYAKATITNAVSTVSNNGTIHIAPGTYNEHNININTNMTIIGSSQKNTIINVQGLGNIFNIAYGVTVTLENITFINGYSTDFGGAIYNQGTLNINNCTFTNNNANIGGAIYNKYGSVTESSNTFTNNNANNGGAIYNEYGSVTESSNIFTNNNASIGGAIYNEYGSLTEFSSIFINNNASIGGAIYNEGKYTNINSIFNNNIASAAGAIYNKYGSLTEFSSTFTHNNADNGGAIYNYGGEVIVNYCRITCNTAPDIYNDTDAVTGILNADNNWWGMNNPNFNQLIDSSVNINSWLVLNNLTANGTVVINITVIPNGGNSTITAKLQSYNKTFHTYTPISECAPMPISFTATTGNITPASTLLINGLATSLFTSNSAGTTNISAIIDNQTVYKSIIVTGPQSIILNRSVLDLTTTVSTNNPIVGVPFNIAYDLTNEGTTQMNDEVKIAIEITDAQITEMHCDLGQVALYYYDPTTGALSDIGSTFDMDTIVNWTLPYVPSDPILRLTVIPLTTGNYDFTPIIMSNTESIIQNNVLPLILNVQQPTSNTGSQTGNISGNSTKNQQTGNNSSVTVKAASKIIKTIGMQDTGLPLAGLVLAVLAIFGGLVPRRK